MIECSVNSLVKFYGANKIFENISFELHSKERVGLIGLNGCGKTTLMKILMGLEEYQDGTISFRRGAKVGYLDQIFKCEPDTSVIEILESSFKEVWEIRSKMKLVEDNLKKLSSDALEVEMKNYASLMEEFELIGGYDIETSLPKSLIIDIRLLYWKIRLRNMRKTWIKYPMK